MTAQEYLEQLAQTAELSADDKAAILKVATGNSKFAKGLEDGVMMRSDYSRQSDALKKDKNDTQAYYSQLVQWKADQDAAYAAALAGTNGNGNGNGGFVNQSDFISKKDFDDFVKKQGEQAQQREGNFINIAKQVGRLASRHANQFHEELDTDALEKIVVEKNVPLMQAYDLMVADRLKQQQDTALSERIKREREEAVREFASTRQIPVDASPRDTTIGRLNFTPAEDAVETVPHAGQLTPRGAAQLRANFIESWNKAGSTGS